jgi:hypothetical protein
MRFIHFCTFSSASFSHWFVAFQMRLQCVLLSHLMRSLNSLPLSFSLSSSFHPSHPPPLSLPLPALCRLDPRHRHQPGRHSRRRQCQCGLCAGNRALGPPRRRTLGGGAAPRRRHGSVCLGRRRQQTDCVGRRAPFGRQGRTDLHRTRCGASQDRPSGDHFVGGHESLRACDCVFTGRQAFGGRHERGQVLRV